METAVQLQTDRAGLMTDVHAALDRQYAAPVIHQADRLGPLSQLVYAIVAEQVAVERADRAFRTLTAAHWAWTEVRDASQRSIHKLIFEVDPAGVKASALQSVLRTISDWSGWRRPSLEFLAEYATDRAMNWLVDLEGVTAPIAAETLLLSSMRRSVLPVDSAHQRIAERVGLVAPGLRAEYAQEEVSRLVPDDWRAADYERHYHLMRAHAVKRCLPRSPRCSSCPLIRMCAWVRVSRR
jgi:endonuclease-3